jgi:imidazolonepropionase-like amidohydrolase
VEITAITNAKIVTVSGTTIEHGTVVLRNGLIAAVGEQVSAPADARVIDGSGLTVYPGLIDANTNLGLPEPTAAPSPTGGPGGFVAAQLRAAAAPPPAGPNSTQPPGLQPEVMVEDTIKPGGTAIEGARNAGITTALTAPRSGIWMGQSALINLAGDTPQEMIVRSPVAMHVGFTPLRTGGYPNSLMGVFAALRQMLLDAQRYAQAQQIYDRSPRGTRRPPIDRSLAALIPVLERKLPVVMYADREREILRALELSREFNLRTIIAGGSEAGNLAEQLRERQVPVLLSLNLPKRTTAAAPEGDPESLRVLRQRVAAQKTAGKLAAAHVQFAFQSGGLTNIGDFVSNAVKSIDNGLARDEALRALTIRAAEIFGVADRMGSIEVGKIANLTVTRGDLFDRNMRVTNVFIDGREVDLRPATPPRAPSSGAPGEPGTQPEETGGGLNGTWSITLSLSDQIIGGTLVLRRQGNSIAGSLQTEVGNSDFNSGTADGNTFHISATANVQGQSVPIPVDGTVRGDSISGTLQSSYGNATFTGSRKP